MKRTKKLTVAFNGEISCFSCFQMDIVLVSEETVRIIN